MRIALYGPDLTGHLNPLTCLGRELARRGHAVTLFALPPGGPFAARAGLRFVPLGAAEYDAVIAPARAKLAELTGTAALRHTGRLLAAVERVALRELPAALKAERIDAVVADQVSPAGVSAADALGLPCGIACNALDLHQEAGVPPPVLGWAYRRGPLGRLRNRLGNGLLRWAARPIRREVNAFRAAHRLPPLGSPALTDTAGLAQVAQQPAFFDFPRRELPSHFHYTGPWHDPARDDYAPFPWDRLAGRPLVYASMGTLQNRLRHVFHAIVEGCATLDVQLVLALGRADAGWDGPTPANAVVVPYAPQLPLLDRAAVAVTHAGLNTALECLSRGVPMVCLPVTNDQPGVARRVEHLRCGEVLPAAKATAERVRGLVEAVLKEPRYRLAAGECRAMIAGLHGAERAADILETAFATGRPVTYDSVGRPVG